MGLDRKFLECLHEFARAGLIRPGQRVIEIGAQQLADPFLLAGDELDAVFKLFGRRRPALGSPTGGTSLLSTAPSSRLFWESLGFSYSAIDFDGHRNSISLNLNCDDVPSHLLANSI
jgi:hypothetical protein